jgi:hypothetical protein
MGSVRAVAADHHVLVGFAEAEAAPEVVWSLVDAGARVTAFARRGVPSPLRHSRHAICHDITPPEKSVECARADLQALQQSMTVDRKPRILFPLDDTALWLCSEVALEAGWILAGPRGANAALALDKGRQIELARECGFNVPESAVVQTAADARAFVTAHGFPVIFKSSACMRVSDGRQQRRQVWLCANAREVERALAEWRESAPMLAQRYIAGTGAGVFGLGTVSGVRAWSAHRRLRMMNPQGSGSSACVSEPVPLDVQSSAAAFVQRTGWRGLFMIEVLRDLAGKVWFVELNGRPWGSMALARRQGLEYPAWHVSLALDEQSAEGRATTSVPGLVCRHIGRELMHLLFVLRGSTTGGVRTRACSSQISATRS